MITALPTLDAFLELFARIAPKYQWGFVGAGSPHLRCIRTFIPEHGCLCPIEVVFFDITGSCRSYVVASRELGINSFSKRLVYAADACCLDTLFIGETRTKLLQLTGLDVGKVG